MKSLYSNGYITTAQRRLYRHCIGSTAALDTVRGDSFPEALTDLDLNSVLRDLNGRQRAQLSHESLLEARELRGAAATTTFS